MNATLYPVPTDPVVEEDVAKAQDDVEPTGTKTVPGLRFEPRCQVCQASISAPDLVNRLHRLRVEQGLGGHLLRESLYAEFESRGLKLPQARAVLRHVTAHLDEEKLKEALKAGDYLEGSPGRRGSLTTAVLPEAASALLQDYEELRGLYEDCRRKMVDLEAEGFLTETGQHDTTRLREWNALVNSSRMLLERLSKIRNSDTTMTIMIHEARKALFEKLLPVIAAELHRILAIAGKGGEAEFIGKRVERLLVDILPTSAVIAGKEAFEETCGRFGLPAPELEDPVLDVITSVPRM